MACPICEKCESDKTEYIRELQQQEKETSTLLKATISLIILIASIIFAIYAQFASVLLESLKEVDILKITVAYYEWQFQLKIFEAIFSFLVFIFMLSIILFYLKPHKFENVTKAMCKDCGHVWDPSLPN